MAITPKEKELVAVGISVAAGCKPCTTHHVEVAQKARASDDEIGQAVAHAVAVRRRATEIMEGYAAMELGEAEPETDTVGSAEMTRMTVLVRIGAAIAVNCVSTLEAHLGAANRAGIAREDVVETAKLATFISKRAASHVERLVGAIKEEAA